MEGGDDWGLVGGLLVPSWNACLRALARAPDPRAHRGVRDGGRESELLGSRCRNCAEDERSQANSATPNIVAAQQSRMLHPTLRLVLLGSRDERSSLFRLSGHTDVLSIIWRLVELSWANEMLDESLRSRDCIAFAHVDTVKQFPEPAGRNVNMMPFLMFDKDSLPEDLAVYWPLIKQCTDTLVYGESLGDSVRYRPTRNERRFHGAPPESLRQRVGYLTVHESVVPQGTSQRRPGLHTEGFCRLPCESGKCVSTPYWHGWGFGSCMREGEFEGGIFMASDVDDSCHVYNALVPPEIVGRGGDIEHLRATLQRALPAPARPRNRRAPELCAMPAWDLSPKGGPIGDAHTDSFGSHVHVRGPISLQANELFWITDRTPHQSVPLAEGTHRRYFRLVAGKVDAWFAAHSTPNPLGTLPDAPIVTIDKFTGHVPMHVPRALLGNGDEPTPTTAQLSHEGSPGTDTSAAEGDETISAEEMAALRAMAAMHISSQRDGSQQ